MDSDAYSGLAEADFRHMNDMNFNPIIIESFMCGTWTFNPGIEQTHSQELAGLYTLLFLQALCTQFLHTLRCKENLNT